MHPPDYPAIAKAAHVQGIVIIMVTFTRGGAADKAILMSGPKLLTDSATKYVHGWQAQPYSGARTCPIVIEYRLQGPQDDAVPPFIRHDPQHVVVNSGVPIIIP